MKSRKTFFSMLLVVILTVSWVAVSMQSVAAQPVEERTCEAWVSSDGETVERCFPGEVRDADADTAVMPAPREEHTDSIDAEPHPDLVIAPAPEDVSSGTELIIAPFDGDMKPVDAREPAPIMEGPGSAGEGEMVIVHEIENSEGTIGIETSEGAETLIAQPPTSTEPVSLIEILYQTIAGFFSSFF